MNQTQSQTLAQRLFNVQVPTEGNRQPSVSATEYYNLPRSATDHDMLGIVYSLIKHLYSHTAANRFISNPIIADLINKGSLQQRVILNYYFSNLLYSWRGTNFSVPVYDATFCLVSDGSTQDWVMNFVAYVLPFMKYYSILGE